MSDVLNFSVITSRVWKPNETKRIGSKWIRSKQNELYKYRIRTRNTSAWWQWMQLTITIAMCLHSALLYEWMLIHLRVHTRTGWTELWWTVGLSMPCDAMRCDGMPCGMRCDAMWWTDFGLAIYLTELNWLCMHIVWWLLNDSNLGGLIVPAHSVCKCSSH